MKYFLLALAMLGVVAANGQELEATVSLDLRQLRSEDRATFAGFTQQLQEYVNGYRWTGSEWPHPKVRLSIQVALTQSYGDGTFMAQILAVSQRSIGAGEQLSPVLRVLDGSWQFEYTRGQPLFHTPSQFNSLASAFDFYALIALGCEADTRRDLGGSDFFHKAYDICAQGQSSTKAAGWGEANSGYSRMSYVAELIAPRYEPLRHLVFSYHEAQDMAAEQPEPAMRRMLGVVDSLLIFRSSLGGPSVSLERFLDAKYLELGQVFANAPDKSTVYRELETIDPSHQTSYEEAKNK